MGDILAQVPLQPMPMDESLRAQDWSVLDVASSMHVEMSPPLH